MMIPLTIVTEKNQGDRRKQNLITAHILSINF